MANKRPFKFTTQEIAIIFWCVGFAMLIMTLYSTFDPRGAFIIPFDFMLFLIMGIVFFFIGVAFPCYQISKWDCNIFMDKLEPGFDGWLRFTKSRRFAPQIVKTGALGQTKGLVAGHKADVIDRGDFPVTLRNGNHCIIKYDLMSHNLNLEESVGWTLFQKKYGLLGANAYKRALGDDKVLRPSKTKKLEKPKKEKEVKKDVEKKI